jgi:hypothetical protein
MSALEFDRAETAQRLRQSLDVVEWAARLVPPGFTHANPKWYAEDAWSVAMNVAHLAIYEERIANPLLAALSGGHDGVDAVKSAMEHWILEESTALAKESFDTILCRLGEARVRQLELVDQFADARWNERATPLFATGMHGTSPHSAAWVANKTFQHTWEHGNAILRMALFAPR